MEWITAHWVEIGVIVFAVQNAAKAIADTTKTTKDDVIIAKIGKILGYFFLGKRPQ
jgi:hypothetical protein